MKLKFKVLPYQTRAVDDSGRARWIGAGGQQGAY